MPPVENTLGTGNLLQPGNHQLHYLQKIPTESEGEHLYLLFASFDLARVDIFCLEMGKEQLHWRSLIRMGSGVDDRHIVRFHEFQHLPGPLIAGIIKKDDVRLSPLRNFRVQVLNQVREEQLHDGSISIGLHQ
jgi:hypothetical protein